MNALMSMDRSTKPSFKLEDRPSAADEFHILVVYDCLAAALRAIHIGKLVAYEFRSLTVRPHFLSARSLEEPATRDQAQGEASRANLVVVTIGSPAELPADLKSLLIDWADGGPGESAALVALIGGGHVEAESRCTSLPFLEDVARRANTELFVQAFTAIPHPDHRPDMAPDGSGGHG